MLSTLATGTVRARELHRRCPRCPSPPQFSRQLAALAPPGQRYGYDLIAWAGLQRYHHMRQRHEIRAQLAARSIALSDGSLSVLCDRFLCLDGWRGWVLHAVRIRSENAAELRPAIQV